jgi:hypothetical protein
MAEAAKEQVRIIESSGSVQAVRATKESTLSEGLHATVVWLLARHAIFARVYRALCSNVSQYE